MIDIRGVSGVSIVDFYTHLEWVYGNRNEKVRSSNENSYYNEKKHTNLHEGAAKQSWRKN